MTESETKTPCSAIAALYDLSQTIGSEMSVGPLLTSALPRFLHHASFPAGFICMEPEWGSGGPPQEGGDVRGSVQARIAAAVGDFPFARAVNTSVAMPKALFVTKGMQEGAGELLDQLLGKASGHTCFLRLAIPGHGFMFMVAPKPGKTDLPLESVFDPALAHLGRAITLCAANDAQRHELVAERDELADKQRISSKLLDSISSGIFVTDANGNISSVNTAFEKLTRSERSSILGKHPRHFMSFKGTALGADMFQDKALGRNNWVGEIDLADNRGRTLPAMMVLSTVRDSAGAVTNFIGIVTDISEKKGAEGKIEFLVRRDPLTALPNFASFKEIAEYSIAKAKGRFSLFLLSLDIDNFNAVNSSMGHSIGDAVLVELSKKLADCSGESDIVCRVSGDHFLILLHDLADRDGVITVAKKILSEVSKPISAGAFHVSLAFTMGVSAYPDDGQDFDTLFKHADIAMKYAKTGERGSIKFFDNSMDKTLMERFSMETKLRFAIENGEMKLHWQPFVDFRTGRVRGAECLVRWDSPDLGRVAPSTFISLAEQSDLIITIGEWVLREACEQCARWRSEGVPIETVSVNLSAVQFKRSDIPALVEKYLKQCDLEPKNLDLELTESIMISDTDQTLKTVADLKKIGVSLSLDDFGTGYSSFSYLSRFPLDKLKIDQSFVRDITIHPESANIVKTIVELGKNLGMATIAEGIETTRQFEMLREFGCDFAQGYLLARPMPAADLAKEVLPGGRLADDAQEVAPASKKSK